MVQKKVTKIKTSEVKVQTSDTREIHFTIKMKKR